MHRKVLNNHSLLPSQKKIINLMLFFFLNQTLISAIMEDQALSERTKFNNFQLLR